VCSAGRFDAHSDPNGACLRDIGLVLRNQWPRKHTEKHGIFTDNFCVFRGYLSRFRLKQALFHSDPVFCLRFPVEDFPQVHVEVFDGMCVHETVVLRFSRNRSSGLAARIRDGLFVMRRFEPWKQ